MLEEGLLMMGVLITIATCKLYPQTPVLTSFLLGTVTALYPEYRRPEQGFQDSLGHQQVIHNIIVFEHSVETEVACRKSVGI